MDGESKGKRKSTGVLSKDLAHRQNAKGLMVHRRCIQRNAAMSWRASCDIKGERVHFHLNLSLSFPLLHRLALPFPIFPFILLY